MNPTFPRRSFLRRAALAAPALAFPSLLPSKLRGQGAPSKVITLGMIGVGGHGVGRNLNMLLPQEDARILAVCDVFKSRRDKAKEQVDGHYVTSDCAAVNDFREILARKDIDAVMISTPDHWHVPMSAMAIRAGKDVICEKPTLCIAHGRYLADLVKKTGTVFQTSTEDRSMRMYHRMAELVRNGRIGKLQRIQVQLPAGNAYPNEEAETPPADLDYDLWLGPAPLAPYTKNRTEWMHWRHIWDYSGGIFSDWGAHQIDTAQWANDSELTGPVEVEGKGEVNPGSMYNTFIKYSLRYLYKNGVEMTVESGGTALRFEGTEGWVGNSGWSKPVEASSKEILESVIGPDEIKLYTNPFGEHRDFLDCVKTRKPPYLPAEQGHRLATVMHIGNIAMKLGRKLKWDPDREEFPGDAEANALRNVEMRKPWSLES
jgi:predicted dehydrogenase